MRLSLYIKGKINEMDISTKIGLTVIALYGIYRVTRRRQTAKNQNA